MMSEGSEEDSRGRKMRIDKEEKEERSEEGGKE